jgi:hypothetical protein
MCQGGEKFLAKIAKKKIRKENKRVDKSSRTLGFFGLLLFGLSGGRRVIGLGRGLGVRLGVLGRRR